MKATFRIFIWSILSLFLLCSCGKGEKKHHGVVEKISSENKIYQRDSVFVSEAFDQGDLIEINEGSKKFLIKNRIPEIKSFDCKECHSKPLEELYTKGLGQKAHWDIKMVHADEKTMTCLSCHNGENMNQLQTNTKVPIKLSMSHQLCNQCHNQQVKDWIGGAHGKNISGWKSPRVSKLCVECHNPHEPALAKRWPSRYNSQMVSQRNK